jgi:hypothetical protein
VFVMLVATIAGIAVVGVIEAKPLSRAACPRSGLFCPLPRPAGPLVTGRIWRSTGLGFQLEYNPQIWKIDSQLPNSVELSAEGVVVMVVGSRNDGAAAMLIDRLAYLRSRLPTLKRNDDPARSVPRPAIGFRPGVGGAYCGALTTGNAPLDAVALAATDRGVTIGATVVSDDCGSSARDYPFQSVDALLNTLQWPPR